jgi:outer membrane protein assembly factor BamB
MARRWWVPAVLASAMGVIACGGPPPYALTDDDCAEVAAALDRVRQRVVAYDSSGEERLWELDAGLWAPDVLAAHGLLFSTRASLDGRRVELQAVDPSTGAIRWSRDVGGGELGTAAFTTRLVPYGSASVAVALRHEGPYAVFDLGGNRTEQAWRVMDEPVVPLPDGSGRDGRLVTSRNHVQLVDPDRGERLWEATVAAAAGPETDIGDVHLVEGVLLVVTRGEPTGVTAIDQATGTVLWDHVDDGLVAVVAVDRTTPPSVTVTTEAHTTTFDLTTGAIRSTREPSEADLTAGDLELITDPTDPGDPWMPPESVGRVLAATRDDDGRIFVVPVRSTDTGDRALVALVDTCASRPGLDAPATEPPR